MAYRLEDSLCLLGRFLKKLSLDLSVFFSRLEYWRFRNFPDAWGWFLEMCPPFDWAVLKLLGQCSHLKTFRLNMWVFESRNLPNSVKFSRGSWTSIGAATSNERNCKELARAGGRTSKVSPESELKSSSNSAETAGFGALGWKLAGASARTLRLSPLLILPLKGEAF